MKRTLLLTVALLFALSAAAQEFKLGDGKKKLEFTLPDSLAYLAPFKPTFQNLQLVKVAPVVSMTSIVSVKRKALPSHVMVIDNNTLRVRKVSISNGQAWNWSSFPDAHLDARTLSFPPRR
ncbi:MAG: hypothetical protein RSB23_08090 [Alistipes sp.]